MPNPLKADTGRITSIEDMLKAQKNRPDKKVKVVTGPQSLDKNSFLKLLVTQLSKQDPLQPLNDREFISQMAQFSSLEQMNNVANSMNNLRSFQANQLVGKVVSGKDFVSGRDISGLVEKIIYDGQGQVFMRIDGRSVKMEDIISVEMPPPPAIVSPPIVNVSRETVPVLPAVNSAKAVKAYTEGQKLPAQEIHEKESISIKKNEIKNTVVKEGKGEN